MLRVLRVPHPPRDHQNPFHLTFQEGLRLPGEKGKEGKGGLFRGVGMIGNESWVSVSKCY